MISPHYRDSRNAVIISTYLVEDNSLIRENLSATLQELTKVKIVGYADTEAAAIEKLQGQEDWQLAIVDLFLKTGSGLKVVEACASRQQFQKVVVLSNYARPDIRKQCLLLGADAVFDKSTDIDTLIEFCLAMSSKAA